MRWRAHRRLPSSAVAVVGVGAVVLVFAAVLSMAAGLEKTMMAAGSENTAVIIRSGSTSELNSGLSNEQTLIIANAPGVLKEGDKTIMSAELYVITDVKKRSNLGDANVPFRGVQPGAFEVRDNVRIAEGRMFEPGKNEIVVGLAAQREFIGLDVGDTVRFGQTEWNVVGSFSHTAECLSPW
jgi:putative ABC transport system permease protein